MNKIRTVGGFHREAKWDIRRSGPLRDGEGGGPVDSDDETPLNILRMMINDLLNGMTMTQQRIIEMRLADHDVSDIAAAVESSQRTVERVLQGFRGRLQEVLSNEVLE
jgi:hypothetical protein